MGVTTGSFYHRFGGHGRFLDDLTDKYIHEYTHVVKESIDSQELPPRELLIEAMRQIIASGLGGMDLHFRALAISYVCSYPAGPRNRQITSSLHDNIACL